MDIDQKIDEKESKLHNIEQQIDDFNNRIRDLAKEREYVRGSLETLREVKADSSIGLEKSDKEVRRMRLGAKKRVIFSLVKNGFETVGSITKALSNTDIDGRYVRDVVRKAIAGDDIHGDIDDRFLLSEAGKIILNKAPVPKDWTEIYERMSRVSPQSIGYRRSARAMPPRGDSGRYLALSAIDRVNRLNELERDRLKQLQILADAKNGQGEDFD